MWRWKTNYKSPQVVKLFFSANLKSWRKTNKPNHRKLWNNKSHTRRWKWSGSVPFFLNSHGIHAKRAVHPPWSLQLCRDRTVAAGAVDLQSKQLSLEGGSGGCSYRSTFDGPMDGPAKSDQVIDAKHPMISGAEKPSQIGDAGFRNHPWLLTKIGATWGNTTTSSHHGWPWLGIETCDFGIPPFKKPQVVDSNCIFYHSLRL